MRIFLLLISFFLVSVTNATTYYISTTSGDDSRTSAQAQSSSTPWKTISKLNSFIASLAPGDNVLFQRGDVFYGSILITKSGTSTSPITFGAYGSGAAPVISGFTTVSSWTNVGSNIWESAANISTLTSCNIISVNGVNVAMGRMPKTGFWTIGSTGGNSITDGTNLNSATTNWTGGQVVLRKHRWIMDKFTISSASGSTINFSNSGDGVLTGWGYFVQNHLKALTAQNDWYYNTSTKKIGIYSSGTPANVEVSTIEEGVNLNGKDYITFDNLNFRGFNTSAINTTARTGIKVQNCAINFIGVNGVFAYPNSNGLRITNSTFAEVNSRGIHAGSSSNVYINGNTLTNIGNLPGMGGNADDSYTGIISNGDNGEVSYNSITNAGYCGVRWDGNATVIKNNFINTTGYVKDDGGGIYCYPSQLGPGPQSFTQRTVRDNIVINSIGAIAGGTPSSGSSEAMGIYNDGTSPNVDYINNTIANARLGLFLNGAHDVLVDGNLIYNCVRGLYILNYQPSTGIGNITVNNNHFVARDASQYAAYFEPGGASMPSSFRANNNVYARPMDDNLTIWRDQAGSNIYNTLAQWKSYTGQESTSSKSPIAITNVNDLRFEYNATSSSKTISLGANYVDAKGISFPGSITLAPYKSAILIKSGAGNALPTANAGADISINLPTVIATLSGSGTDPDGTIASYSWSKVSGPTGGSITTANAAVSGITSLVQGVFKYELKVTDNAGSVARDTVQVTVNLLGNTAPTANAGADQNVTLPVSSVSLSGSGTDVGGTIVSYAWAKISGPAAGTITAATSPSTAITGLTQGTYQFELTVTDNGGATAKDIIQVIVNAAAGTNTPYTGTPKVIPGTIEVEDFDNGGQNTAYYDLTADNAGGMYRPSEFIDLQTATTEGGYFIGWSDATEWTKYTVNVTATGVYTLTTRVSAMNATSSFRVEMDGTTIATITVPNTAGYQNWQTVTVPNINLTAGTKVMRIYFITGGFNLNSVSFSTTANAAPTANAGVDQTITLPTSTATLTGTGTDTDGTIASYSWKKLSGPTGGTITSASAASTAITALIAGTYVFELTVTDNKGATAKDNIQVSVNAAASGGSKIINVNVFGGTNPYSDTKWNNWSSTANNVSMNFKYEDGTQSTANATLSGQASIVDNATGYASTATVCPPAVLRYTSSNTAQRTMTVKGLSAGKRYTFKFYASSKVTTNGTSFLIGSVSDDIMTYNNVNNAAQIVNVIPDANGTVVVKLLSIYTYNYISGFTIIEQSGAVAGRTAETTDEGFKVRDPIFDIAATETSVTTFPNPFTTSVQVKMDGQATGVYQLSLFEVSGKNVWKKSINKSSGTVTETINTGTLTGGMYILQIVSPDQKRTSHKIIKAN